MDYSQPFSLLNERLRPPLSPTEQLYSSLSRVQSKASKRGSLLALRRSTSMSEPEDDGEEERISIEPRLMTMLSLSEVREDATVGSAQSEEAKEGEPCEQTSDEPARSESPSEVGGSPFQRSCMTLPDLINSGRPLGRRRTLGHVSDTLKEVRREVELSRRRSIKLKAQVDKLQESREGPGWSRDRDRVTEEVLSILSLLQLMTDPNASPAQPPHGGNRLDAALAQLQDVARKLAMTGTQKDVRSKGGSGSEDSALLQQALRDRDEAIEKKKAMEAELLRSKTEMMLLNNQLLEAAQKRLELSLELEAWKEDVQLMLQQQLLLQHQVEQNQKKTSRVGILRRNKPPIQRPTNFPVVATHASPPSPASPTQSPTQNFFRSPVTKAPAPMTPLSPSAAPPSWRDKWKRSNGGRRGEQDAAGHMAEHRDNDGFHVVSLD
ncbi:bicaudal-D-related protein 2-like [Dunckerocampus dactyliophorus]|uniref:bicaudal-D-related protein 2-like n=1 Tax=Dunckerocampus dactyliophorus TaxID=161453 RepID=UPI00240636FB|nr:bicaudal-D-related protein 2-like [Dunckerocampus dactyliophorus]